MPRKSERHQLLQDLDLTLIATLSYTQINQERLASRRILATRNSTGFLSTFLLVLLNSPSARDFSKLVALINWLISTRHQQLTRKILLKSQREKVKSWRFTSALVMHFFDLTLKRRYLMSRDPRPQIATLAHSFNILQQNNEPHFRIWARMSHSSFDFICNEIRHHYVFYNNSNHSQAPVEWQLLVALSHLGLNGNGGSPHVLAQVFNISEGSVENYTNRCLRALIDLESKYVKWPSHVERQMYCAGNIKSAVFTKCVGFVDGTIIPLTFAPSNHKEDYWMRKMMYGLNSLIVCDCNRKVIYSHHGWCGSAHDQRVLKYTKLYTNPSAFFSTGEYLLADSGYTASETIIPAFKRVRGQALEGRKQAFNTHLSQLRVEVEHCIGMIKNRWQSLKNIRLKLKDSRSAGRLVIWIRVCIILHNILVQQEDSFQPSSSSTPSTWANSGVMPDDADNTSGENTGHRDKLFKEFVSHYLTDVPSR